METVGFGTGTSLWGLTASDRDLCLIPLVANVGVNEATALMVAVDPSTTATIDETTLRCAIPCAALHDVSMGTQKTPGLEPKWLEPKWLRVKSQVTP